MFFSAITTFTDCAALLYVLSSSTQGPRSELPDGTSSWQWMSAGRDTEVVHVVSFMFLVAFSSSIWLHNRFVESVNWMFAIQLLGSKLRRKENYLKWVIWIPVYEGGLLNGILWMSVFCVFNVYGIQREKNKGRLMLLHSLHNDGYKAVITVGCYKLLKATVYRVIRRNPKETEQFLKHNFNKS